MVIWSHDLFHRDHIQWLPQIKRTKAKKSAPKKTNPVVRPSSSSPESFCETQNEVVVDRGWLQKQFAIIEQQNRHMEEQNMQLQMKLDFLIRHTTKQSLEYVRPGSKRSRTAAQCNISGDATDDSFKDFIDEMMLPDNLNEESKSVDEDELLTIDANPTGHSRRDSYSFVASIMNSLGSEPGHTSELQDLPLTPDNQPQAQDPKTEWIPRTHHVSDKVEGPDLIYSSQSARPITSCSSIIDPDETVPEWVAVVPPSQPVSPGYPRPDHDDEEGGIMDMTLVSAHLVESSRGISFEDGAAQIIADQQRHASQLSKRVMWAITILGMVAVISIVSAVVITQHEASEIASIGNLVDSNDYYEYEVEPNDGNLPPSLPFREDTGTSSSVAAGSSKTYVDDTQYPRPIEIEENGTSTSSDYASSESTRRWKNWSGSESNEGRFADLDDDSNHHLNLHQKLPKSNTSFIRDFEDNDKTSLFAKVSHQPYSELSMTINGEVQTFHCRLI